jgi:hypothetical protein
MTHRFSGNRHGSRQAQWCACGAIVQDIADVTDAAAFAVCASFSFPRQLSF